jgi:hypothetical protein
MDRIERELAAQIKAPKRPFISITSLTTKSSITLRRATESSNVFVGII